MTTWPHEMDQGKDLFPPEAVEGEGKLGFEDGKRKCPAYKAGHHTP